MTPILQVQPAAAETKVETVMYRPNVTPSSTGHFGGEGGGPIDLQCARGEALRGVYLRGAEFFFQVGALCSPIAKWEGDRAMFADTSKIGPKGQHYEDADDATLTCPKDAVVIGMTVGRVPVGHGFMVGSVSLHCAPVVRDHSSWRVAKEWAFETEERTGSWGIQERSMRRCESGIATAVIGRTGAWVDALGLDCDAPSLDEGK
jgi:hypothetical protein